MKTKITIIVLAILAVLLIASAVVIWMGVLGAEAAKLPKAPDFTCYTADGTPVNLSDFAGKPVVLNFWASWCGPCKSEMPAFEAAYQSLGEDVQFLMVNLTDGVSETVEGASAFLAEAGYTFPVFFDTQMQGSNTYQVSSIPATFFVNKKGKLVASHVGAMDETTLQNYLNQIT